MVKFSIVTPIKDEKHLIPRTLPSYYEVNPSEVILCLDKPAPKHIVDIIRKVAKAHKAESITRIVEVERNPEYTFHQAWVRRKGFLQAKYDRILTTDIDLVINKKVLKAVEMVGADNVALVSCCKFRTPNSLTDLWRCFGRQILRLIYLVVGRYTKKGLRMTLFSGLYALYKPYWLETDELNAVKDLVNPKQTVRGEKVKAEGVCLGEDTFLRNCLEKQYRVVYLKDVGSKCLSDLLHDHPHVQFELGRYNSVIGRSFLGAIIHTVLHAHKYYLRGYLSESRKIKFNDKRQEYSLEKAREYWQYSPCSIGSSKTISMELKRKTDDYIKRFIERSIEERNIKEGAMVYRRKVSDWIKKERVKYVLDFGCGLGQDGVYFSRKLNVKVTFADIVESNTRLTSRYNQIWGIPTQSIFIDSDPKTFAFPEVYDMIFANGVLHHAPEAKEIVQNLTNFLVYNGIFICMLYTPKHFKATRARNLEAYARKSEGLAPIENPYSDYYDEKKARDLFIGFALLDKWTTHKGKFGWYVFGRED